jgi:hypothetical protein
MNSLQGFCGATYALDNKFAAVERCVNLYPTPNESPDESKFKYSLSECPGNAPFGSISGFPAFQYPCRGLVEWDGLVYGVNGTQLFSLDSVGNYAILGGLAIPGTGPVKMIPTPQGQLFITVDIDPFGTTDAFIYYDANGAFPGTTVRSDAWTGYLGTSQATFQDGYILAITTDRRKFQISGNSTTPIGDFTLWDEANISFQGGQADRLQTIISWREYIRLFGSARSQVYYNAGNQGLGGFPFQSFNSTFIETGIGAVASLANMGESLIWVGNDARGMRACWEDSGFHPQRISTFAVEQHWQEFVTVADAVAFAYLWKGHLFYQITFPAAGETWVHDKTASAVAGRPLWHERTLQWIDGTTRRRPELYHCFCYGAHLVGSDGTDGNPGAVYKYADTYSDVVVTNVAAGVLTTQLQGIVPMRITPNIYGSGNRIRLDRLRFDMEAGVGLPGTGPGSNPMLKVQISRDAGNSYGPIYQIPIGQAGKFKQQIYLNRLGYGRDMVFKVYGDGSAVPYEFVGAYFDGQELGS